MADGRNASRPDVEAAARLVLENWERLDTSHKVITGGCSCGAHGIVLGLADFEQDIGDYLRNEGEQHQRRDVLALLQDTGREGDAWSIPRLLRRLLEPDSAFDSSAASFVIDRLARTVHSFEQIHGGR